MIAIYCEPCGKGAAIIPGADDEVESVFFDGTRLSRALTCPYCQGKDLLTDEVSVCKDVELRELTAAEGFAAFSGLGFPSDQDCSATAVREAFTRAGVVGVVTRPIRGSHRSVLESIELADGTKLFLGASVHGAIVYRIAQPEPDAYTKEALRGA